ncbi:MAG TPA: PQQ-dependent sugar dehydrogenase [Thermodesulfobacteriota bacterium]|nr:PQQ-dependent sugar dehydrogenase [Thermodesulfobacteriota bacterium]
MKEHRERILLLTVCAWILSVAVACGQQGTELIENREGYRVMPEIIQPTDELVSRLKLPPGFIVTTFAKDLGAPRMMAVSDDGTVYITRQDSADVIALQDADGDGKAEAPQVVVKGLPGVHGITLHNGAMYLCTVQELYVADMKTGAVGQPKKIMAGIPPGGRHPNRTIAFGPDEMLYISIGSTCNCCIEEHPESASIVRVAADGSTREIFATGLRNTIGFDWHPESKLLYGMDHGTDWLGDDFPPEELNRLEQGKHYGWPFVYGRGKLIDLQDYPEQFDSEAYVAKSTSSLLEYTAHSAPIQMVFYTASQFPEEYRNDAFVAMHGSWNRKPPSGYEVTRITFDNGRPTGVEPFLTGFLLDGDRPQTFARPAGIAVAKDGSLLVGCDTTGVVYRISYQRNQDTTGR